MLTRFVRNQLIIFTIVSVVGVAAMALVYMQLPTLLGIGRINVTLELPRTAGLYRFANVTYRGVQIGKVTDVHATRSGAEAKLSLATSPKVPADLTASVLSVSAVGEQYVDLLPRNESGPYLRDGSVIPVKNTTVPQKVGPMLDQVSVLLDTIPKDQLAKLLDETYRGFNGAADDLGSLYESAATLSGDVNKVADRAGALIADSRPLLDGQVASADALRTWARSLAGITGQIVTDDAQVRTLLNAAPGALDEVSNLLTAVKPTLPVLLANMTTVGQIAVTYHASLEQLMVLLPPYIASIQAVGLPSNNPTGFTQGEFTLTLNDPPACTVGFLPPSSWRSPSDLTDIDTPDGLYCKLPQDSPIAVRGARNYPCMGQPGKRAPTVEICESDRPFEPLAMRQHVTGAYPLDPNLIGQGIPPDDRTTLDEHIYGPLEGTPLPPGPAPAPAPASVAPSAFHADAGPSVAIATYDPATGRYATPDGAVYRQTDLTARPGDRTWKELLPTA